MAVELQARATGEPAHVIIVGAGLAGLCTAFELESKGLKCTILEAETCHVGGRVRTHRFTNGQYGELGAMRIPDKHLIVRGYTEQFGLKTRPFFNSHPNAYFHLKGRTERRQRIDRIRDLFALRPWECDRSLAELWLHAVSPIVNSLTQAERADLLESQSWKTRKVHDLDHRSLHQVLERAGLSPDGIEFLTVAWGLGETLLGSAFTEHLREDIEEVWEHDFAEIVGGMERLPLAFQSQLRDKPKMGCEVVRFEQDDTRGRVAAVYRTAGAEARLEADYLVCTIPFSVLQRVDTVPAFSGGKQRAIRQIFYESATKVLLQTRRRFWETDDAIFGGASFTDLLTGPIFYPSDNRLASDEVRARGPGVLVASYNWGEAARRLGCLPRAEREKLAINLVSRVHPQLTAEDGIIEDKVSWSWHSHKWSCGAFAFYQPGQFARLHRDVIAPEGRIHFAGEHASRSHTWMEGALESARRAAGEILERTGQE